MFTKHHFEVVAETIKKTKSQFVTFDAKDALTQCAVNFCDRLASENERFDREKFLKACGVDDDD